MNLKLLIILVFPLCFSGCYTKFVTGAYIPDNQIKAICEQKPSKDSLINMVGQPTIKESDSIWYYIATTTAQKAFFDYNIIDTQILKVEYNADKLLYAILLPKEFRNDINILNTKTDNLGNKKTIIQQYIDSFGKYNKKKKRTKQT